MPHIPSFPSIFQLQEKRINIISGVVEITEKVDGSLFGFGVIDGELVARSKGKEIIIDAPEGLFKGAVDYIQSIKDIIPPDIYFYAEYLRSPKHNALKYDRTPKNGLYLFAALDTTGVWFYDRPLTIFANRMDIDPPRILGIHQDTSIGTMTAYLDGDSYLGGVKLEGIVAKRYDPEIFINGKFIPAMGKVVRNDFKEKLRSNWKGENTGKGKWESYCSGYKTEARWRKSVQHLRDDGRLENSQRDIGSLIKAIQQDIIDEEKENIKEDLWRIFGNDLLRRSIRGFPEWYKKLL